MKIPKEIKEMDLFRVALVAGVFVAVTTLPDIGRLCAEEEVLEEKEFENVLKPVGPPVKNHIDEKGELKPYCELTPEAQASVGQMNGRIIGGYVLALLGATATGFGLVPLAAGPDSFFGNSMVVAGSVTFAVGSLIGLGGAVLLGDGYGKSYGTDILEKKRDFSLAGYSLLGTAAATFITGLTSMLIAKSQLDHAPCSVKYGTCNGVGSTARIVGAAFFGATIATGIPGIALTVAAHHTPDCEIPSTVPKASFAPDGMKLFLTWKY